TTSGEKTISPIISDIKKPLPQKQEPVEQEPVNFEKPEAKISMEVPKLKLDHEENIGVDKKTDELKKPEDDNKKKLPADKSSGLKKEISIFKVSLNEKVFLAKHLATIIKAGISLPESLRIVAKQTKGKMHTVLLDVITKVEGGKALNVALSDHKNVFDPLFINMVKVGETSGTLDESLHYLSLQLTKDSRLISKVKSASLYPSIVLITAFVVGGGVSYFVLPKLTKLFTSFGSKLPLSTRILLAISDSIQKYGVYWLIGLVVGFIFFVLILKIYPIRHLWHKFTLKIPIIGNLMKNLNLARISLTLGTLMKSSVSIDEALEITKGTVSSIPYQVAIKKILDEVRGGKSIGETMILVDPKSRLFPGTFLAMVQVGEKTGTLYDSLLYTAEFCEEEVDNITKDLATALEPILLILIAIVVGFVAIAIVTPMYSILGVVNK
ncbi:MAG: type II secretory pathway, component PulF, partial [Candidatus Berkelbacteria bacterium Athens1014_28]